MITWKTSYNVHSAQIGFIRIELDWHSESHGYRVCVIGDREVIAKQKPADLNEAKRLGLLVARGQLNESLRLVTEALKGDS